MTIMDNFIRVLSTTQAHMLPVSGPLHIPAHKQRDPRAMPGSFRPRPAILTQPKYWTVERLHADAARYPEPQPIDPVEPDMQDASWA